MDNLAATRMARDIAKKVEGTMQYPEQIKVTVIRESRASEFAKYLNQIKPPRFSGGEEGLNQETTPRALEK